MNYFKKSILFYAKFINLQKIYIIVEHSNSTECYGCDMCFARNNSVFSILTANEINEIESTKNFLTFCSGELIFKEKHRPFGIYIIQDGKVKISKYGYEGKEYIVRFANKGSIMGYRAFFNQAVYSCSATAISDTNVCFIPGDTVNKLIKCNQELGFKFMKQLALDLKAAEEKAISVAHKPARERVAESLLILKDVYGYEEEGTAINISLKRDEIAGIAGTSRETTTRLLSEFADEKVLSIEGRKISILNLDKLKKISNKSFLNT